MMRYHVFIILLFLFFINLNTFVYAQVEIEDFFEPKTTIGGYGELHYNYEKVGDDDPKKILDFHRFVVYVGHAWTEEWSFRSEIELEHNIVKNGQGILQLEQSSDQNMPNILSPQPGLEMV